MTGRFTSDAKQVIAQAIFAAREQGHSYVGSEHLLFAIASFAPACLAKTGVTAERVKKQIEHIDGRGEGPGGEDLSPGCRKILIAAGRLAAAENSDSITVEHILASLLGEECVGRRILESEGVSASALLLSMNKNKTPQVICEFETGTAVSRPTPYLDRNGRDLSRAAKDGELEEIACREAEEERVMRILMRKTKNNPCLIGDAGVGKTAIAESIALRIERGDVPEKLKGMRVVAVDMPGVVAGTKYRGEFEEKLKNIINDARNNNVILFVDELHTIVGAGSAEGSVDASNILKPPLARGEIRMIGATTPEEYRRIIAKDPALERRFQQVTVKEPAQSECADMLLAVKKYYESHHGIRISEDAIYESVRVSSRFITGRKLPDKAIDLIDEAASEAVMNGKPGIDKAEIDSVCAAVSGVPLAMICGDAEENTRFATEEAGRKCVCRGEQIAALARTYRKYLLRRGGAPVSALICGPEGSGRSFLAKTFAESAGFPEVIRVDLSEFCEPYSVSRLTGAYPGYSGAEDGRTLAKRVKRSPCAAVIFESVSACHPDAALIIKRILSEGVLTDSCGIDVNFSDTFILLTDTPRGRQTGFLPGAPEKSGSAFKSGMSDVINVPAPDGETLYEIALKRACDTAAEYAPLSETSERFRAYIAENAKEARSVCEAARLGEYAASAALGRVNDGELANPLLLDEQNGEICVKVTEKKT